MKTRKRKNAPSNNVRDCKSEVHQQETTDREPTRVHTVSSRDFPISALNALIDNGVFSTKSKYICDVCLDHGRRLLLRKVSKQQCTDFENDNDETESITHDGNNDDLSNVNLDDDNDNVDNGTDSEEIASIIDTLIQKLRADKDALKRDLVKNKLTHLLEYIGREAIQPALKNDTTHLQQQYQSAELLRNLDSKKFLQQCNSMLLAFLLSVTGRKLESMDSIMLYTLSVSIESIYHVKNRNLVLPHTFTSNLLQTVTSGSKTVTEVNGKISPAASDTTYRTWFYNQGLEKLATPKGNVDVFIDNIGKYIEKNYRVSASKNSSPTVVTAVLNIPLKSEPSLYNIQDRNDLKPRHWAASTLDEEDIQERMQDIIDKSEEKFREYRFRYVGECLNYIQKETAMETAITQELQRLQNSNFTRKCNSCSMLHLPRKQKCPCGGHISSLQSIENQPSLQCRHKLPKYFSIGEILDYNPTEVSLNEPIMLNPNSLTNLKTILDKLKSLLLIDGREWAFIGADGPPYALMRRIIEDDPVKYDWVVLVSGKGHLGMNQLKTFFKIIDPILGEALGKDVLNFNTPKSYSYFVDCKDTHKSWQSLEIFLHGTTMELLDMYSKSLPNGEVPTVVGFLNWQAKCEKPTFKLVAELTLNIALAIYVQRVGDRHNDETCSDAGRYKFLKMFYGFNHPIYREVEYNELRQKAIFPQEISEIRAKNISFSSANNNVARNHEGGDFKLENKIKQIKSITPKGKKDVETWRKTIRATPTVCKVVQHCRKLLGLYDAGASRITRSENEIIKWRALLRHKSYLSTSTPFVQSFAGERLNDSLQQLGKESDEKRLLYWEMVLQGVPMESIRYDNINVLFTEEAEADEDTVIDCFEFTLDSDDEGTRDEGTSDEEEY